MTHAEHVEKIEAAAEAVWPFLQWENLERMKPGGFFEAVDYEERRPVPGAKRRIRLAGGAVLEERLESVDEDAFHLVYRMLDTGPFPIADYLGEVRLSKAGPASCFIRFASTCTPHGLSEEDWRAEYRAMQTANVAYIRKALAVSSSPSQ
jgi:hypothetical protein